MVRPWYERGLALLAVMAGVVAGLVMAGALGPT